MKTHWCLGGFSCTKLNQSELFEHGGIYGIEWRIAKSKLSNDLKCRGIYGMTFETIIDPGDAIWQVWGSLKLVPITSFCSQLPVLSNNINNKN